MNILKPALLASILLLSGAAFASVRPKATDISTLLPCFSGRQWTCW